jgi:hypothetical protein
LAANAAAEGASDGVAERAEAPVSFVTELAALPPSAPLMSWIIREVTSIGEPSLPLSNFDRPNLAQRSSDGAALAHRTKIVRGQLLGQT